MAVYTHVNDEDLRHFLENYELGLVTSFKGIAEGVENSNFLLSTETGNFILTLYEKRVSTQELPFFLDLMAYLSNQGIPCPTPVVGLDGGTSGELCGRPAALVTFLDGMSAHRPTAKHCAEVGQALAHMHKAGREFGLSRDNDLSIAGWRDLVSQCRDHADEAEAGLENLLAEELSFLQQSWPTGLPSGVIHADLFPDNVFFLADKLSGVIDFYFACNDFFAYDLAICLNAWCFERDGSFNATKAHQLTAGYNRVRPLEDREISAMPVLARGAAFRFLLTRLYDWENQVDGAMVRPKDPGEYIRKLRFHRRVKGPGEYGLS